MTYFGTVIAALGLTLGLLSPLRAEVLAKVGSDPVTREEFDRAQALEAQAQKRDLSKEERVALLHSLVNQRLLVAEARSKKADRDPAFVAARAEFERRALADQVYNQEIGSKSTVTLEEAKRFYEQNPGLFDLAQVSQVLVAAKPGQEAAQLKRAEDLKARLAKSPKRFAETAKAESDDALSKPKGGDLGTLRRGMLLPELEAAVFSAKPGSVLGPVKTQYGYHILQVRSLKRLSWDEAGQNLQGELQRLRSLQLQQALLERLNKAYKVSVSEDKL